MKSVIYQYNYYQNSKIKIKFIYYFIKKINMEKSNKKLIAKQKFFKKFKNKCYNTKILIFNLYKKHQT